MKPTFLLPRGINYAADRECIPSLSIPVMGLSFCHSSFFLFLQFSSIVFCSVHHQGKLLNSFSTALLHASQNLLLSCCSNFPSSPLTCSFFLFFLFFPFSPSPTSSLLRQALFSQLLMTYQAFGRLISWQVIIACLLVQWVASKFNK